MSKSTSTIKYINYLDLCQSCHSQPQPTKKVSITWIYVKVTIVSFNQQKSYQLLGSMSKLPQSASTNKKGINYLDLCQSYHSQLQPTKKLSITWIYVKVSMANINQRTCLKYISYLDLCQSWHSHFNLKLSITWIYAKVDMADINQRNCLKYVSYLDLCQSWHGIPFKLSTRITFKLS